MCLRRGWSTSVTLYWWRRRGGLPGSQLLQGIQLSTASCQGIGYPHHHPSLTCRPAVGVPAFIVLLSEIIQFWRWSSTFIATTLFSFIVFRSSSHTLCLFSRRTVRVWLKRDSGQYWPSIYHAMPCKYKEAFIIYCVFTKCLFWFWWSLMFTTICKLTSPC